MKYYIILIFTLFILGIKAQTVDIYYSDAFFKIESMLSGKDSLNFKQAVFTTENAYFENQLDETVFNNAVLFHTSICRGIMKSGSIVYPEKDSVKVTAQCAVFVFMTDTIPIKTKKGTQIHSPFTYNFNDFAGQKDWSSMFVSTLMQTQKGNCHSLPYLYKMIMDELGQPAYLSLAPNHIYTSPSGYAGQIRKAWCWLLGFVIPTVCIIRIFNPK